MRCTWCNQTSYKAIAYHPEDYNPAIAISIDPRDETAMICSECADAVFDAVFELQLEENDIDEVQD